MAKSSTKADATRQREVTISLRAQKRQRVLIDQAAAAVGKTRSDFMLESACTKAEEVLLDRRYFSLGEEDFAKFLALLDAPPQPNEGLQRLLSEPDPWDNPGE